MSTSAGGAWWWRQVTGSNWSSRARTATEGAHTSIPVDEDSTVTLDEAGKHRYRLVEHDRGRRDIGIYGRV